MPVFFFDFVDVSFKVGRLAKGFHDSLLAKKRCEFKLELQVVPRSVRHGM